MLKRFAFNRIGIPALMLTIFMSIVTTCLTAQEKAESFTERLGKALIFERPLVWVGKTAPSEAESESLWRAFGFGRNKRVEDATFELEQYIKAHPQSPWTPGLRSQLARIYAESGRFTRALGHWEAAWEATKNMDGHGKAVADFTFAHWTRLLANLGRAEALAVIYEESKGRRLGTGPLRVMHEETMEGFDTVRKYPDSSPGCGGYAMAQIARKLKGTKADYRRIAYSSMPARGYSFQNLQEISDRNELDVISVKRMSGKELITPCVAHIWQNHYYAILEEKNGKYFVVDPALGRSKWLPAEYLNEELSGHFLVPRKKVGSAFKATSKEENEKILGKGFAVYHTDALNTPPCGECECPPGGPTGPAIGSCGACSGGPGGMPSWMVFEPYINLWVVDEPLAYVPANGPRISLKLFYKQRSEREFDSSKFSFGPDWNCSWISYVDVFDGSPANTATLYVAGGGKRHYVVDGTTCEYETRSRMSVSDTPPVYTVEYPSGAKDQYGLLIANEYGAIVTAYLTRQMDERGRTTEFSYSTNNANVRLISVFDADGRTNSISYTNHPVSINLVASVTDGYGRSAYFSYDSNGRLTNITDVIGISSQVTYGTDQWLERLITPYGTNTFSHIVSIDGDSDYRGLIVTEPDASHQMFLYKGTSEFLTEAEFQDTNNVPPQVTLENYASIYSNAINSITNIYQHRNSYHWDRQQFSHLSANFLNTLQIGNLTASDYAKGRMRHWEKNFYINESLGVAHDMLMEREPSPVSDGSVRGKMTWYDYESNEYHVLNALPRMMLQVQPDGTDWYEVNQYDSWGNRTNIISTYSNSGTIATRTNSYVYAANGIDLLSIRGPDGQYLVRYGYTNDHLISRMTNANNEVTSYTYNGDKQLTGIVHPNQLITTNLYSNGWLVANYSYAYENGQMVYYGTNSYSYSNGRVYSHTDGRGLTRTFTWDNLGRLTQVTYPDSSTMRYYYDKLDLVRIVDRMGYTNAFSYNKLRQIASETNPRGGQTTYSYCNCGAPENIVDALSQETIFQYDNQGNRVSEAYPDSYNLINEYDSLRRLTRKTEEAGKSVWYYYNNQGLTVGVSNNLGVVARYSYDIYDRVTSETNSSGLQSTSQYDLLGRLTRRTYPTGAESWVYSSNIQGPTYYTNLNGMVTQYAYNAMGWKTQEVLGYGTSDSVTNRFEYNAAGDLTRLWDGRNNYTRWEYNVNGQLSSKWDANNTQIISCQYNANGWLTNRVMSGKTASYAYDASGNVLRINYSSGGGVTNAYNLLSQVTTRIDSVGTTTFGYTPAGLLESEDGPWDDDTVTYSYFLRQRTGMTFIRYGASDWVQSYIYDASGRLRTNQSPAGQFVYSYHTGFASGNWASTLLGSISLPQGMSIGYQYDSAGRMTNAWMRNSSQNTLSQHGYAYNGEQRTRHTRTSQAYVDYGYDGIGQLKTAIGREPGGTLRLQEQMRYGYDKGGNWLNRTNNALVETAAVNNLNQLTSIGRSGTLTIGGTVSTNATEVKVRYQGEVTAQIYGDGTFAAANLGWSDGTNVYEAVARDAYESKATNRLELYWSSSRMFQYDSNGNLASDGKRGFAYDDENQLIGITQTNSWKAEFKYDGQMRLRVRKEFAWADSNWVQTNEVRYIYDGFCVMEERNAQNWPIARYTRGLDLSGTFQGAGGIGGILARTDMRLPTRTHVYYHADGNGNVTTLVNEQQAIVGQYIYDSYGNLVSMSGTMADVNPYRFSSKEYHSNSGLYYYGYRFYDPNLQRWLNRDPIGEEGGINLYGFVGNEPITGVDVWGLQLRAHEQLEFEFMREPFPRRWGPRQMPEDEVLRLVGRLEQQGTFGKITGIGPGPTPSGQAKPVQAPVTTVAPQTPPISGSTQNAPPNIRYSELCSTRSTIRTFDRQYSVIFDVQLRPGTFTESDANHFRQGNRQLYEILQTDPAFAARLEAEFPGITAHVTPGPRGGFRDTPPNNLTWHHNPKIPGNIQLIPRPQHQASGTIQTILHPRGQGGREVWGGGR